jgi:hypothetical protein
MAGEKGILGLIKWDDNANDPVIARAAEAARTLARTTGGSMATRFSFAEVPTYISGGEWERVGLSFDEAVEAYDRYLQFLEAAHRPDGVGQVVKKYILVLGALFMNDVYVSDDHCKVSVLTPEQEQMAKEYRAKRDREEQEAIRKAEAYWKGRRQNANLAAAFRRVMPKSFVRVLSHPCECISHICNSYFKTSLGTR